MQGNEHKWQFMLLSTFIISLLGFLFHGLLLPAFHVTGISSMARHSRHLFLLACAASGEWGLHLGIEDLSVGGIMGICQTLHQQGYHCPHEWPFNSLRNTFIAKQYKSEHFFGKHLDRVLLGSDDITRVCSHPHHSWCLASHHVNCCQWDKWAHTLVHGVAFHWSWL